MLTPTERKMFLRIIILSMTLDNIALGSGAAPRLKEIIETESKQMGIGLSKMEIEEILDKLDGG